MSISGSRLRCKINGVTVAGLHDWEADDSGGDVLDATTGEDGGFTNTDTGCADLKVTLRLYFDITNGIDVVIAFGTVLTNLLLYRHLSDATPAYTIDSAVVIAKPTTVQVRGRVETTVTVKNKGSWTENVY